MRPNGSPWWVAVVVCIGCASANPPPSIGARPPAIPSISAEPLDSWARGELPSQVLEGTPRRGGQVVVHMWTEPPPLCTIRHSDLAATLITHHKIYESLLALDPYDHPSYRHVPELAIGLPQVSADGRVHVFRLRPNVRWHDGTPFTSRDVVATFDTIRDPAVQAEHLRSYFVNLESVRADDAHTVTFRWSEPYMLAFDSYETVQIMPAHILESVRGEAFNAPENPLMRQPVGTGPWKLVEWAAGSRVVLDRNDDW